MKRPLLAVLVTDRIYSKTVRYLEKLKSCLHGGSTVALACIAGFPSGLDPNIVRDLVLDFRQGTLDELSVWIRDLAERRKATVAIVGLNQSAVLPAEALRRAFRIPARSGHLAACNKVLMRERLLESPEFRMPFAWAVPGAVSPSGVSFEASRFVVKPALGMSSRDVWFFDRWSDAVHAALSPDRSYSWLPEDVASRNGIQRSDIRIIEPYIHGTEFSIDGWIDGDEFQAIVQHKLSLVRGSFIGDGPTVSPPLSREHAGSWSALDAKEPAICLAGKRALQVLGFGRGVFHIEARWNDRDGTIGILEVNPRAPGGSLWRSAQLRTGIDLETVDAALQLGEGLPIQSPSRAQYVLHYPFYAKTTGVLEDWGDLDGKSGRLPHYVSVDLAARIGDRFDEDDLIEEPYLAFAVAGSKTVNGLMNTIGRVLSLNPPTIRQVF